MDLTQPQVDHGQPQDEKCCPDAPPEAQEAAQAAALGEQVSSAGAQSHVPPLQSHCSSPGPSSAQGTAQGTAQTLSAPGSVLEAPEPGEEAEDSEEEGREVCHPLQPCPAENYMEQELTQEEVNRIPEPSQEEKKTSNKTSPGENWRRITIRTVWVNPNYPQLLRDPRQEEAKAATPSASDEQVLAAGTQSLAPDTPCCSPCPSATQLAAQTLGGLPAVHRQPSRRALQALCTLLWCSCMELQCPPPD